MGLVCWGAYEGAQWVKGKVMKQWLLGLMVKVGDDENEKDYNYKYKHS